MLDAYQSGDYIFIEAFTAGVSIEDLNIELTPKKITISGKRNPPLLVEEGAGGGDSELPPRPDHSRSTPPSQGGEYLLQELQWLSFSRELELPSPVDVARAQASESQGHLIIRLPKV